ncbi:alpha-isopropylmalate synthase regulatory domain-containing protein, partial [Staphylococcus aureus]
LPTTDDDQRWGRFELLSTRSSSDMSGDVSLDVTLRDGESVQPASAVGNGPVAAFLEIVRAQGFEVTLYDYVEHALSSGGDAQAAAY